MGKKKKLLQGAGDNAAPKLSFAVHHPRKAAMTSLATWALGHMTHRRHRHTMGSTAAKGLGAAAIALPVGLWLGRRMLGHREPHVAPM